jgi:hypothetical protein
MYTQDIEELRGHDFSDTEILDSALVAAARNFFSKVLDAVGTEPDAQFLSPEENLRKTLAVGRQFG